MLYVRRVLRIDWEDWGYFRTRIMIGRVQIKYLTLPVTLFMNVRLDYSTGSIGTFC